MKLAIVCQPSDRLLPPQQTPVARWSYQVAGRLTTNADVTIFGRKSPSQTASIVLEDSPFNQGKLRFRFIRDLPNWFWSLIGTIWGLFSAETYPLSVSRLFYLPYCVQIALELRRDAYDIVHIHNLAPLVAMVRLFNPHIQIILHVHDRSFVKLDAKRIQAYLDQCDRLFAPSDLITKQVHERFPQTKHFCQTQFHGVDIGRFRPIVASEQPEYATILYVGTLHEQLDDVLEAFTRLAQLYVHANFVIASPKRYKTAVVERLCAQIPDSTHKQINIINGIPREELLTQYKNAQVVVNVDADNPFNIVLVEAGACGVPCVAIDSADTRAIVENKRTGFLVNAGDSGALATRISDLLLRANVRRQMGMAARKRVARLFSWRKLSRSVLYSYRLLLDVQHHAATTKSASTPPNNV